jgi:hypothetical protein
MPDPMTTVEMTRSGGPGSMPQAAPVPPPAAPAAPQFAAPPPPAANRRVTSSGISEDKPAAAKDYGLTATVTLSRSGMGMTQKRKQNLPAPEQMKFSVARGNEVACPQCRMMYPITPEVYGAIAECSECLCEFQIRAPSGSQPTSRPAPAPEPAVDVDEEPAVEPAPKPGPAPSPKPSRPAVGQLPPTPKRPGSPAATRTGGAEVAQTRAMASGAAPAKSSGLIWILAVVIVLLVAVIAVGGYFLFLNK